ncbi:translation initiation factor IF-2-like [Vulpes lagopus]|uniref:translation initiation factor IF-2-like n=1 Tax=Vulpes lagopus TaxID=494514 RepID=UPI001BC8F6DA|nr:translation initiation factor IF-2-like [Vulpes lagopus]
MAPGGAAGRAEAQGRGESSRRAAAAPEPRARRAGGAGRRLEPARQLGPPSGRLKGQAALRAGGGRGHAWCARPLRSLLRRGPRGPPAEPPCSHPSGWAPAPRPCAEPPRAGKSVPESNLGAFQLRHRGGGGVGGGPRSGSWARPLPHGLRKGFHLLP